MIFNTTFSLGKVLAPLSQEEIFNTPEFYAMSFENILKSGRCPKHLKRVIEEMELGERPNVIQVRPQDFRERAPYILGDGWHVDVNTNLANGREHRAKSLDEFSSRVVSFGDVAETEFIAGPFEVDTDRFSPFDHSAFAQHVACRSFKTIVSLPNQLAKYTSRDIHRVNPNIRLGRMRLIIVTFECEEAIEETGGQIRPSIREKNHV